jgi:hypothetical protein
LSSRNKTRELSFSIVNYGIQTVVAASVPIYKSKRERERGGGEDREKIGLFMLTHLDRES